MNTIRYLRRHDGVLIDPSKLAPHNLKLPFMRGKIRLANRLKTSRYELYEIWSRKNIEAGRVFADALLQHTPTRFDAADYRDAASLINDRLDAIEGANGPTGLNRAEMREFIGDLRYVDNLLTRSFQDRHEVKRGSQEHIRSIRRVLFNQPRGALLRWWQNNDRNGTFSGMTRGELVELSLDYLEETGETPEKLKYPGFKMGFTQ